MLARGVGSGFGKWMQTSYAEAFTEAKMAKQNRKSKGKGRSGGAPEGGGGGEDGVEAGAPRSSAYHDTGSYDHVYIDVNNVLHVAAHHTRNEEAFFKKLFALLDLNLRKTRPQYTVTLALDGPAPIAKTITQRRRRIRLSSGEKVPLSADPPRLLKIGLTPGSTLSFKIDRALEYYAATRLLSRNALPRGLLFEISGTRVPGEGEVKILRSMKTRVNNPRFKDHSHLIVSEDSDALLLAMTAAPASTFVLSSKLVFSVAVFNRQLARELPAGTALEGARRDFVALAVMMGNDYLPGSRFGVKYSWRAYVQLRSGVPGPWAGARAGAGRGRSGKDAGHSRGGSADPGDAPGAAAVEARGHYCDSAMFPRPTPAEEEAMRRSARRRGGRGRNFGGEGELTAVCEEGKMAFRRPPPVHWAMLVDFARILSDPDFVKWQVSDGLRPRSDIRRPRSTASATRTFSAAATAGVATKTDHEGGGGGDDDNTPATVSTLSDSAEDNLRSTRRAYEYIHGVGWVLEMYYSGTCMDYGYNFQHLPRARRHVVPASTARHSRAGTGDGDGSRDLNGAGSGEADGRMEVKSREEDRGPTGSVEQGDPPVLSSNRDACRGSREATATVDPTAASSASIPATSTTAGNIGSTSAHAPLAPTATDTHSSGKHDKHRAAGGRTVRGGGGGGGGGGRLQTFAVDVADFLTLPLSYDPSLDPLRDRLRASMAYQNRYPITPLAYSLAVIPRGGRAMLAPGARRLVDPGSPVYHLFKDDYCPACFKHRIAAGPLERVIQMESQPGPGQVGDGAPSGGGGSGGGRERSRSKSKGRSKVEGRTDDVLEGITQTLHTDSSRKFAGGDQAIREAAAAGGYAAREMLRRLNRRHQEHLQRAPQHASHRPPPLNELEGAVARVSLDGHLSANEETLRTLGDQPVLMWHQSDPGPGSGLPALDAAALTLEEEVPDWAASVIPPGCRPIGRLMHEIRRYDGDAALVVSSWSAGGETAAAGWVGGSGGSSGGAGGRGRGRGNRRRGGGEDGGAESGGRIGGSSEAGTSSPHSASLSTGVDGNGGGKGRGRDGRRSSSGGGDGGRENVGVSGVADSTPQPPSRRRLRRQQPQSPRPRKPLAAAGRPRDDSIGASIDEAIEAGGVGQPTERLAAGAGGAGGGGSNEGPSRGGRSSLGARAAHHQSLSIGGREFEGRGGGGGGGGGDDRPRRGKPPTSAVLRVSGARSAVATARSVRGTQGGRRRGASTSALAAVGGTGRILCARLVAVC